MAIPRCPIDGLGGLKSEIGEVVFATLVRFSYGI
jgi:hypothetical protein